MTNGRLESSASKIKVAATTPKNNTARIMANRSRDRDERKNGRERTRNTTQLHAAIIKIRSVNQIEFQCANYHWLNEASEEIFGESESEGGEMGMVGMG